MVKPTRTKEPQGWKDVVITPDMPLALLYNS